LLTLKFPQVASFSYMFMKLQCYHIIFFLVCVLVWSLVRVPVKLNGLGNRSTGRESKTNQVFLCQSQRNSCQLIAHCIFRNS
jgi:hypothetical protein